MHIKIETMVVSKLLKENLTENSIIHKIVVARERSRFVGVAKVLCLKWTFVINSGWKEATICGSIIINRQLLEFKQQYSLAFVKKVFLHQAFHSSSA